MSLIYSLNTGPIYKLILLTKGWKTAANFVSFMTKSRARQCVFRASTRQCTNCCSLFESERNLYPPYIVCMYGMEYPGIDCVSVLVECESNKNNPTIIINAILHVYYLCSANGNKLALFELHKLFGSTSMYCCRWILRLATSQENCICIC